MLSRLLRLGCWPVLVTSGVLLACGGGHSSGGAPVPPAIDRGPCGDFELDVERFWSSESKAAVNAGVLKVGGEWTARASERVVTKMDQITRDWVMTQESVCKDTLVRQVMSKETYVKVSSCLRSCLRQQRTLVETLCVAKPEHIENIDGAMARVMQDSADCEKEAIYSSYDEAEGDSAAGKARMLLADARVYRDLQDGRAEHNAAQAKVTAEGSQSPYVRVDALLADADAQERAAKYESSLILAQEALRLAEASNYPLGVAEATNMLGVVYNSQGDYRLALDMHQRALPLLEAQLGAGHAAVANTLGDISAVYANEGEIRLALAASERSLMILEQLGGAENLDLAGAYSSRGALYLEEGDYAQALAMHQKALGIFSRVLGPEHPDVATCYAEQGLVYWTTANYAEARKMQQKALDIRLKAFGPAHPAVAQSYQNLGDIYLEERSLDEALQMFQQALSIRLKVLGPDHAYVGATYNGLGQTYNAQRKYAEALAMHEKALELGLRKLGRQHPVTTFALSNIRALCAAGQAAACALTASAAAHP